MACVFTAILMIRILKENKQIDATSVTVVVAKPINERDTASKMNAAVNGTRLSYRDTSQPDIGKPINELIGMKRRMVPNSASLYPKVVLIVGIREAQVEKQTPERKKNTLRKNRCLFFDSIRATNRT